MLSYNDLSDAEQQQIKEMVSYCLENCLQFGLITGIYLGEQNTKRLKEFVE